MRYDSKKKKRKERDGNKKKTKDLAMYIKNYRQRTNQNRPK